MARAANRRTTLCALGVNGGESPRWSVAQICDLAVKLRAKFVELAVNWAGLVTRFQEDRYRGPVPLEPHLVPHEMGPAMEADAAFPRHAGWVR
jgi:hypothetical protein